MSNLLKKIDFGNEAGDDNLQPEELSSFFVEQEMFQEFTDSKHKIRIATAKKGVGKSALIQWIAYKINEIEPEAVVIKCRGADLVRNKFNLTKQLTTPNDYIDDWMIRICATINRELATRIKLAVTDDQITMIESAEIAGYKERNILGCLLDRFQKILGSGTPTKLACQSELNLLKRVNNRKLWILIDDLDATFQKTSLECLQMSTFFSACSDLPPKKWTQRRVGGSMNASSKTGGVQWQGKTAKRHGLTGISRSRQSRWSLKADIKPLKWPEVLESIRTSFIAGSVSSAIAARRLSLARAI